MASSYAARQVVWGTALHTVHACGERRKAGQIHQEPRPPKWPSCLLRTPQGKGEPRGAKMRLDRLLRFAGIAHFGLLDRRSSARLPMDGQASSILQQRHRAGWASAAAYDLERKTALPLPTTHEGHPGCHHCHKWHIDI